MPDTADTAEPSRTNFVHIVCDHDGCTHTLSLGQSETIEEAVSGFSGKTSADVKSDMGAALYSAAALLGWRRELLRAGDRVVCADHATGLVCYRCRYKHCRCRTGPSFNAVRSDAVRTSTRPIPPIPTKKAG